ncbi:WD40/YVTN/BNR-like repeat-containing protein [Paenibacillus sp. BAC0078]
MNWTKKLHHRTLTLLSAGLLAVSAWGAAALPAQAAKAAPACGTGDHGLLRQLQAQHSTTESAPLGFTDIQFLNADIGRAAGNGFMIGTSDGGCHFQEIYQGPWNFKQIDFPDNVKGWALASAQDTGAAYLIATTDGGSTWKRLPGTTPAFERIDFKDSKQGFGYSGPSTYYTKDGGLSWSQISTPKNTRGAEFTSRSSGWAVVVAPGAGYRVMKTTDGGATWQLSLKSSFAEPESGRIYASGDQVYALLYGGTGMSQTSYSLYASSNKGRSWSRVIAQDTAGGGPAPGSGPAQLKSGPASGKPGNMVLVGSKAAFLAGFSPAAEKVAVGRSYNAGKQWTNLPSIPGYDNIISFTSVKEGWMAVRGQNTSSLYATEDGGSTWKLKFAFKGTEQ